MTYELKNIYLLLACSTKQISLCFVPRMMTYKIQFGERRFSGCIIITVSVLPHCSHSLWHVKSLLQVVLTRCCHTLSVALPNEKFHFKAGSPTAGHRQNPT